jgi:transposase-like protein
MAKVFDDLTLVEEYSKCKRCRIVAEKYGCSDETVRRALIKFNVPRIERHPRPVTRPKATEEELRNIVAEYYDTELGINGLAKKYHRSQDTIAKAIKTYGHGKKHYEQNSSKISDDELRLEVEQNPNAQVIAEKYGMSIERVCRRCSNLGLKVNGSSRNWKQRAKFYGCNEIDPSITLDRLRQRDNNICQICGEVVDASDITDKHIGARYPSCDHIIPLSKGGTHTWSNVQLAHMGCNSGKCNRITVKREGV